MFCLFLFFFFSFSLVFNPSHLGSDTLLGGNFCDTLMLNLVFSCTKLLYDYSSFTENVILERVSNEITISIVKVPSRQGVRHDEWKTKHETCILLSNGTPFYNYRPGLSNFTNLEFEFGFSSLFLPYCG